MAPATLTPPRERVRRGTGSGTGKPWRVIVLNDDHNTFQGVAYALSNVLPGVSYDEGMALANRIHDTGQAIVWSGEKETRGALLDAAPRLRADDGAARAVAGFCAPDTVVASSPCWR